MVGKAGFENVFASPPESLKSFDCLTLAMIDWAGDGEAAEWRAATIVTVLPFGSESCRSETTFPFLEICQAAGDPAGRFAPESVTLAGNVTSAEPSWTDLAVFVITTFTL